MATSKGQEMLSKAIRSKAKRSTKKRGMVANAVGAYKQATNALQSAGKGIRTATTNAVNTRVAEQQNYDKQIASGNNANYYGTASQFKSKRKPTKKRSHGK